MDLPGITGTLRLAGLAIIALPLIAFGVERTLGGSVLGLGFVALDFLVVALERLLVDPFDPIDVTEEAIDRALDRVRDRED